MNHQALLNQIFGADVLHEARAHAVAEYPRESCGYIAGGRYHPCENKAKDPKEQFEINDPGYTAAITMGVVDAVVHSHPDGPIFPSELDMRQQIATNVPWIIVPVSDDRVSDLVAWGDSLPIVPIIERPFVHGILDCYSCIRDAYRLGQDELRKQGCGWPHPPIELDQVPRDDAWWKSGQDLYVGHIATFGFRRIARDEAKPGDIWMMALGDGRANPHKRINHAGVLLESNLVLHHLPMRLSRREPAGIWFRAADIWVRYEGPPHA